MQRGAGSTMNHLIHQRRHERGATLIITMVMLVLITMVCVSTIRTSTVDERLAGATRDREKAFQAAEAAVQQCLRQVKNATYAGTPLTPATSGNTPNWEVAANWSNGNSVAMTVDSVGLAAQPRCMYEALGAGSGSYRITGRAVGASALTEVVLQATYTTE
jgi:type IV pilus assembly protein PilX